MLVSFATFGDSIQTYACKHADVHWAAVAAACQEISGAVLM